MEDRSYFIEMPRDLTSYEFYTHVLPIRNEIEYKESDIILDFSRTFKVEPLVIPNLLCFGYELGIRNGNVPKIYFPDTSYSGEVKNYLNEIGFFHYANKYGLFEFCSSPYSGLTGKKIDPICGTLYFDTENTVDEINRGVELCIAPFADEYLYKFECIRSDLDQTYYVNDITEFLSEIIMNCKQHAHSFSFTTLHAKYSAKKIYISVSDFGCGFLNTIASDLYCKDEVEAILCGVYKRKESKVYGLYNIIRRVLEYNGKVRIHSNSEQLIFTPKILTSFLKNELLKNDNFKKYNIKRNVPLVPYMVSEGMRKKEVKNKLEQFKKAKLIITDRLHGMIFATITATPCIAFGNSNGKVKNVYGWLKHNEYIKYVNDIDEFKSIVETLDIERKYYYDKTILYDDFEPLLNIIKEIN